ncbi:MAG TPA: VWA domain-containing protein, partial [Ktedonobacteraceae bacterium]|nr:VWA domain-containing protein [Ktedonobacteraceae bacterium]
MLTFEQPLLLLLLLPIGVLVVLAWRNMSLPFPRGQRRLILLSRLALFALIICALAGAAWSQPVSRQAVVFVGDISASTQTQRAFIENWINAAIKQKGPDDQVGIVAVGRNALVEQSVRTQIDFTQFQSTPDTNYTDLAAGLRLAAAILPTDSLRRIVLLSDGQQNLGDALQEAQLLQQEGTRLDIVPLPTFNSAEARIDGLDVPTELHTNERFLLHTRLFSTVAQAAILRLYLDQSLLLELPTHLV